MAAAITNVDFAILDFIQAHLRCAFLDFLMPFLSKIGAWGIVWLAIGVVLLFFRKTRRCAILMLISLGIAFFLGEVGLKNVVCRVRPCNVREMTDMLVEAPKSFSFPSGHSAAAFSCATILFLHHRKIGIAAYVLAVLICFSRLYLYVHYPTDVLAGAAIGVLVAILVFRISQKVKPQQII